jgi:outer membrane protein with beta-barrel domain
MRASLRLIVTLSLLIVGAPHAYAQRRVPATGMWGLGGSIGAGLPSDPSLSNGFEFAANLERYVTPRVSIRGQLGGMSTDIVGRHFTGTLNPVILDGNVVYNWEGGAVHPFVTGGGGIYFYRSSINGVPAMTDTRPGFDFGGGLELFFNRRTTMTTEALYHVVSHVDTPITTFNQGQFWTLGVGVKRYF